MLRKFYFILLLSILSFILIGCDAFYYIYDLKEKAVTSVELIYYDNPDARENPSKAYPFDQDKLEILDTLNVSNIEDFLEELANLESYGGKHTQVLFSHDGIGIRIIYEDDYFEIITLTTVGDKSRFFTGEYDHDGNALYTTDIPGITNLTEDFNNLIKKYFQYE